MAFEKVMNLNTDNTIKLGGRDKLTGKENKKELIGYYLGAQTIASKLSKTGTTLKHVFQTPEGTIGVWGTSDLDKQLAAIPYKKSTKVLTEVVFTGMAPSTYGSKYTYSVGIDRKKTIEVVTSESSDDVEETSQDDLSSASDFSTDFESDIDDSTPVNRATAPKRPATSPNMADQARVQALLSGKR